MIRVKVYKEKKPMNELLGLGTTGKSKEVDVRKEVSIFNLLQDVENKIGTEKLKKLGLSLTDKQSGLFHLAEKTLGYVSGKVGSLQSIGMSKTQALINLLEEEYKDILDKHSKKSLSQDEANELIHAVKMIATFFKKNVLGKLAESVKNKKLEEAFGMQNRALQKFIDKLKLIGGKEPAFTKTLGSKPPPPPPEAMDDVASAAAQAAMKDEPAPPEKKMSPEEVKDKVATYSKMASKYVQQKLNKMVMPHDAEKVVALLMSKNYLKEASEYETLIDKIASQTGMDKEVVSAIFDSLKNSFKGELEKMHLDKEREEFVGMGTNESKTLKEHLIEPKKQEVFNESDAKRFKILAGLI